MPSPQMIVTVDCDADGCLYTATMGEAVGYSGLRQVANLPRAPCILQQRLVHESDAPSARNVAGASPRWERSHIFA